MGTANYVALLVHAIVYTCPYKNKQENWGKCHKNKYHTWHRQIGYPILNDQDKKLIRTSLPLPEPCDFVTRDTNNSHFKQRLLGPVPRPIQ